MNVFRKVSLNQICADAIKCDLLVDPEYFSATIYGFEKMAGRYLFSDSYHHRIVCFAESGEQLWARGTSGNDSDAFRYPRGICVMNRLFWVCDAWNHRVQAYDAEGNLRGSIPGPQQDFLVEPSDIVCLDSAFHIVDRKRRHIVVLDKVGRLICFFGEQGREADAQSGDLIRQQLTPGKVFPKKHRSDRLGYAHSLARDESGGWWVASVDRIDRLGWRGEIRQSISLDGIVSTRGICIDGGHLFLADEKTGEIIVISLPDGLVKWRIDCAGATPCVQVLQKDRVSALVGRRLITWRTADLLAALQQTGGVASESGSSSLNSDRAPQREPKDRTVSVWEESEALINRLEAVARRISASGALHSRTYAKQNPEMILIPDPQVLFSSQDWLSPEAAVCGREVLNCLIAAYRLRGLFSDSDNPSRIPLPGNGAAQKCAELIAHLEYDIRAFTNAALRAEDDPVDWNDRVIRFVLFVQLHGAVRQMDAMLKEPPVQPQTAAVPSLDFFEISPVFAGWETVAFRTSKQLLLQILTTCAACWEASARLPSGEKTPEVNQEIASALRRYQGLRLEAGSREQIHLPMVVPSPDHSLGWVLAHAGFAELTHRIGLPKRRHPTLRKDIREFLALSGNQGLTKSVEENQEALFQAISSLWQQNKQRAVEQVLLLWSRIPASSMTSLLRRLSNAENVSSRAIRHAPLDLLNAVTVAAEDTVSADIPFRTLQSAIPLLLARGRFGESIPLLRRYLLKRPSLEAASDLCIALKRSGDGEAAAEIEAEIAEQTYATCSWPLIFKCLAHWGELDSRCESLAESWNRFSPLGPETSRAWLNALINLGHAGKAINLVSGTKLIRQPDVMTFPRVCHALISLERIDEAMELIGSFEQGNGRSLFSIRQLFKCAIAREDREQTEQLLAAFRARDEGTDEACFMEAFAQFTGGDEIPARNTLERIGVTSPHALFRWLLATRMDLAHFDTESALVCLDTAGALQPENPDVLAYKALAYLLRGDLEAVERVFEQQQLLNVHHPLLTGMAGCLSLQRDHFDEARALLKIALATVPAHPLTGHFIIAFEKLVRVNGVTADDRDFLQYLRMRQPQTTVAACLQAIVTAWDDPSSATRILGSFLPQNLAMLPVIKTLRARFDLAAGDEERAVDELQSVWTDTRHGLLDAYLLADELSGSLDQSRREAVISILQPLAPHRKAIESLIRSGR